MYKLAPSLLAADFKNLCRDIGLIERAGAHYLHIDVMDGVFVNNISFGAPVIKSIRGASGLVFDAHLMIIKPERYLEAYAEAGADIINVHAEACGELKSVLRRIRALGVSPAVTVKPETGVETIYDSLPEADMVLIMSVEPGFGGQKLLPHTLKKAERLAGYIANNGYATEIEIDGGVNLSNAREIISAGVNILVAGSSVFGADDIAKAVRDFYGVFSTGGTDGAA